METMADRLRALRKKSGIDPETLADQIGITVDWYEDLEKEDGELQATLDLSQFHKLALLLKVGLGFLSTGEPIPESVRVLSFVDVAVAVRRELEHSGMVEMEERTGWDLGGFLRNREMDGWEQKLGFFEDVCKSLNLDWRGVLRYCELLPME